MSRPNPFIIQPPADFLQQRPNLEAQAQRLSQAYEKRETVTEEYLRAVGTALWEALQLGNALTTAKQACGLQVLPILIETGDAAIQMLPWETLHHPTYGFLGREPGFSLSRRVPDLNMQLPPVEQGPLRVLLFTSLPDDLTETERLDVEREQEAVQIALLAYESSGQIVLEMPDDGRFSTFQHQLQVFKPHLVYLSGHGTFTDDPLTHKAWGSFLFENEWGAKHLVSESEIVKCFQNTPAQLLVLSACLSAKQHASQPNSGLSQTLYRSGLPHVIGIRESVFDVAGIQFALALLGAIGQRQPVNVAVQYARAAIVRPWEGDSDPQRAQAFYGQWCLPQLLSHDLDRALVDWDFALQAPVRHTMKQLLSTVALPLQFIGRRRELRRWQNQLRQGGLNSLLITGAGGVGKTALAGKLVKTLEQDGYKVFAFSLRAKHDWRDTVLEMELDLSSTNAEKYQKVQEKKLGEAQQAKWLLRLLSEQYASKLVVFFDNLESVQDLGGTHALTDTDLQAWITAAHTLSQQGLKLILTSRWQLPGWPAGEHHPLGRPVYGDYLAFARRQPKLPQRFLHDAARMRRAYEVLGGNFRALEFFATAAEKMNLSEETAFLNALNQAEVEIQIDMALAEVVAQRSPAERELLHRLLAYQTPVSLDGVKVIARPDLAAPAALLDALLAVSLVEQIQAGKDEPVDYQLSPLVADWLRDHGAPAPTPALLGVAADFLLWL